MTAMPQMVAIFNGAGGGAAAVVAIAEFLRDTGEHPGELLSLPFMIATLLGAVIGSVSLTGSIIAFGKLQGIVAARPVKYPGSQVVTGRCSWPWLVWASTWPRSRTASRSSSCIARSPWCWACSW